MIHADLAALSRSELEALHDVAARILETQAALAREGKSVVSEVLRGVERFEEWGHYPEGDHWDPKTGGQYYYHAHAANDRVPGELGHFHVFLRPHAAGLAPKPASVSDGAIPADPIARAAHLVGISTDARGRPFRLFTTNRWVCAETWYTASECLSFLDRFALDRSGEPGAVNGWLADMLTLYHGPIGALMGERDRVVAQWAESHPGELVYEDRSLQVTSSVTIDLAERVGEIEKYLGL
ncbi:MAG: hypothetical protein K9H25_05240 [Rhodospirillum sp.]|nr:hypothetical protein [Rhodospirillum sp.]MCF8488893.1 hypothetical protein [Rhodospirillum sp.]MCF8500045.1 hypothetical protein [Rhodospirillum sp.]